MNECVLEVKNLKVEFSGQHGWTEVVHGISFSVDRGRISALVGESGCGKSVTALSLLRLLGKNGRMSSEQIRMNGKDITDLDQRQRHLICGSQAGIIFQDPQGSLDPLMRVGDSLCEAAFAHQKKKDKKEIRRQAAGLLLRMGMRDPEQLMRRYPHELSGGMCQRIMIATAMFLHPPLLIADEPTTALDVTIQAQILEEMTRLCRDEQTGILFITHDLSIVAEIADDIYVMKDGNIVETGRIQEVFRHPRHSYTKMLLDAAL